MEDLIKEIIQTAIYNQVRTGVMWTLKCCIYSPINLVDLNSAQTLMAALFHSVFSDNTSAVVGLLPLTRKLPHFHSSFLGVWLKDDFIFRKEEVGKTLRVLARLVIQDVLTIQSNIVKTIVGLEEKYGLTGYFCQSLVSASRQEGIEQGKIIGERLRKKEPGNQTETSEARRDYSCHCRRNVDNTDVTHSNDLMRPAIELVASSGVIELAANAEMKHWGDSASNMCSLSHISTNIWKRDPEGNVMLHEASSKGNITLIKELLNEGVNVNVKNRNGMTPLHLASTAVSAKLLMEHGANVNARSSSGDTPLHTAARKGYSNVIIELIPCFPTVDLSNDSGETPLYLAALGGHSNVVNILVSGGADVNYKHRSNYSLLHKAASEGEYECVKQLLDAGAFIDCKSNCLSTPLLLALNYDHRSIVMLLLGKGANVNEANIDGITPLHTAVISGELNIINALLDAGALSDVQDDIHNWTPLVWALHNDKTSVVKLLTSRGINQ